jgi:hypothetical protein
LLAKLSSSLLVPHRGVPATMSGKMCVFVGNIPYDCDLQKLQVIFSEVGTIVQFRCALPGRPLWLPATCTRA